MSDTKETWPDIATIQPDRLIKYRISDDRFYGEVLFPGLWYTDFDRKTGGNWTLWAISKTFEAIRWYGWMNGLFSYYELVSGRNRTFFNATTAIHLEENASDISFNTHFGFNKPFKCMLYISQIGNTSFTYTVDMIDYLTNIRYGRCHSKVVYVDAKSRRPIRLPEKLISEAKESMNIHKIVPHNMEKMGHFEIPSTALPYKLKVLHSDCDRNLHVNQSTFVRWFSDALYSHLYKNSDFTDNNGYNILKIENMIMQYLGEALVNENLVVYIWKQSEQIMFAVINDHGKQIFNAKLRIYNSSTLKINNHLISKL